MAGSTRQLSSGLKRFTLCLCGIEIHTTTNTSSQFSADSFNRASKQPNNNNHSPTVEQLNNELTEGGCKAIVKPMTTIERGGAGLEFQQ